MKGHLRAMLIALAAQQVAADHRGSRRHLVRPAPAPSSVSVPDTTRPD